MIFQVQIRVKNKNKTEKIKFYKFEGLFDAQNKALGLYKKLIESLKPEAIENENFLIWVLRDGEPIEIFKSKVWKKEKEL